MGDPLTVPWALRLETSRAGDGAERCVLFALAADGAERRVAAWPTGRGAERPAIKLAFSPSRRRAAVRVGNGVWTVQLADGAIVAHVMTDGTDGDELTAPMHICGRDEILVWDGEERASCVRPGRGDVLDALVGDGISLTVVGPVDDDGGEASSGSSGQMVYFTHEVTEDEVRSVIEAGRQESARAAQKDLHVRVVVAFGERRVVVHDATSTLAAGIDRLQWPVHVGPRGVLLRRSRVTAGGLHADEVRLTSSVGNDVMHPWLVTPDGTVTTLPFELGNGPLATLPDGRFLLPCWAPMWWDGPDEPLTALDDDGDTEPLLLAGEPLTPDELVSAFDPALVVPRKGDDDVDDAWRIVAARVDGDTLAVALERDRGPGNPWLVAAVPLVGTTCGPPRLVASGRSSSTTTVCVTV